MEMIDLGWGKEPLEVVDIPWSLLVYEKYFAAFWDAEQNKLNEKRRQAKRDWQGGTAGVQSLLCQKDG